MEDYAEALNFYPVETPQPLCKVGYETYRSEETQRNSSTFGPEVPIRGCPTMGCFFVHVNVYTWMDEGRKGVGGGDRPFSPPQMRAKASQHLPQAVLQRRRV